LRLRTGCLLRSLVRRAIEGYRPAGRFFGRPAMDESRSICESQRLGQQYLPR